MKRVAASRRERMSSDWPKECSGRTVRAMLIEHADCGSSAARDAAGHDEVAARRGLAWPMPAAWGENQFAR
jgi:hypothetical protein